VRAECFRIHVRVNGLDRSRLGVSVGRKFGPAVVRNRFKRMVREAFRQCAVVREAGLDIVVVARDAKALDAPEEMTSALVRAAGK
jgi:ribonuclease P protein component